MERPLQGRRTDEFRCGDRGSPEFMTSWPRHAGRADGSGGRDRSSARSVAEPVDSRSRSSPPWAGPGHRVPDSLVLPSGYVSQYSRAHQMHSKHACAPWAGEIIGGAGGRLMRGRLGAIYCRSWHFFRKSSGSLLLCKSVLGIQVARKQWARTLYLVLSCSV